MKKKIGIALSLMMFMSLMSADLSIVSAENKNQEVVTESNESIDKDISNAQIDNDEQVTTYNLTVLDQGKCGDNAKYQLTSDGTLTISGSGDMTSSPWDSSLIKKVVIKSGITSIDNFAFSHSNNLIRIDIPATVNKISYPFLPSDSNLNTVNIDKNNKYYVWENNTLFNKNKTRIIQVLNRFTSYTVPDGIKVIDGQAFFENDKLKKIYFPKTLVNIEGNAFAYCSNLSNIQFSDGVKTIGGYAFSGCTSLTNVTLPDTVTTIGEGAFCEDDNLTNITLSKNLTTITMLTFSSCSKLKKVDIPSNVDSIGWSAFNECSSLQTVSIPKKTTAISPDAFVDCNNLTLMIYKNSYGETFAKENKLKYTLINEATVYKITYNLNNGTNNKSNPKTYKTTTNTITLKNPTRKGYSFAGWYSDSKYKTKVTTIKKGSKGNKTLYAKWNKVTVSKAKTPTLTNMATRKLKVSYGATSGVKGYQIQYATNSKFTGSKTKTTTSRSSTLTSLTKGKRYYVRVRGYKIDSTGNKVYGAWSTVKNIKISK